MSASSTSGLHAPEEPGQQLVPALGSCLLSGWWGQQLMATHKSPTGSGWPLTLRAVEGGAWFLLVGPPAVGVAHTLLGQLRQQLEPTFRSLGCCQNPGLCLWCQIETDRVLGEVEMSSFYCFARQRGP